jgi:hypothetical protein
VLTASWSHSRTTLLRKVVRTRGRGWLARTWCAMPRVVVRVPVAAPQPNDSPRELLKSYTPQPPHFPNMSGTPDIPHCDDCGGHNHE